MSEAVFVVRRQLSPKSRSMRCAYLAEMRGCSGSRSLAALEAGNAGGGVIPDLLADLLAQFSGFRV